MGEREKAIKEYTTLLQLSNLPNNLIHPVKKKLKIMSQKNDKLIVTPDYTLIDYTNKNQISIWA